MSPALDDTDRRLVGQLRRRPRAGISDLARRLALARGTVQSRLERLIERGIITGFGPDMDAAAAGYDVRAFTTLSIAQGRHDRTIEHLSRIPEVLEVHTVTGSGDLLLKIVATTNEDLHRILQEIAALDEVSHTETQLALATPLLRSVADLVGAPD
ncbi:MAG: Lrp/AsnC family transcriptional regulator [Actinomycetota bacterium]